MNLPEAHFFYKGESDVHVCGAVVCFNNITVLILLVPALTYRILNCGLLYDPVPVLEGKGAVPRHTGSPGTAVIDCCLNLALRVQGICHTSQVCDGEAGCKWSAWRDGDCCYSLVSVGMPGT